jgi:hypothetical protein
MTKIMSLMSIIAILMFAAPKATMADAYPGEWSGRWQMNHDGFVGTLFILLGNEEMGIRYRDAQGRGFLGRIERLDQSGQHLVFYIYFPQNAQRFDAYIFSWDKTRMAGMTYWGGRTFGFYAVKR